VEDKPAFKKAFAARRCLLPADGYYEWYGEKGKKQPFFIHPKDDGLLAMAGLYEFWKSPEGEWLFTVTVLTTQATDELGHIHDRMPMLVEPDRWDAWLGAAARDAADLRGLLVPAAPGLLDARPVSSLVNNVANNGPELLEPVDATS
jgi:putative SOS response-associated peptidase YedK